MFYSKPLWVSWRSGLAGGDFLFLLPENEMSAAADDEQANMMDEGRRRIFQSICHLQFLSHLWETGLISWSMLQAFCHSDMCAWVHLYLCNYLVTQTSILQKKLRWKNALFLMIFFFFWGESECKYFYRDGKLVSLFAG